MWRIWNPDCKINNKYLVQHLVNDLCFSRSCSVLSVWISFHCMETQEYLAGSLLVNIWTIPSIHPSPSIHPGAWRIPENKNAKSIPSPLTLLLLFFFETVLHSYLRSTWNSCSRCNVVSNLRQSPCLSLSSTGIAVMSYHARLHT